MAAIRIATAVLLAACGTGERGRAPEAKVADAAVAVAPDAGPVRGASWKLRLKRAEVLEAVAVGDVLYALVTVDKESEPSNRAAWVEVVRGADKGKPDKIEIAHLSEHPMLAVRGDAVIALWKDGVGLMVQELAAPERPRRRVAARDAAGAELGLVNVPAVIGVDDGWLVCSQTDRGELACGRIGATTEGDGAWHVDEGLRGYWLPKLRIAGDERYLVANCFACRPLSSRIARIGADGRVAGWIESPIGIPTVAVVPEGLALISHEVATRHVVRPGELVMPPAEQAPATVAPTPPGTPLPPGLELFMTVAPAKKRMVEVTVLRPDPT